MAAAVCLAQPADLMTLSGHARSLQNTVKNYITKSADKMPEADYGFRPTPDVRSFAELIGHITEDNYVFCSAVLGDKKHAGTGVEEAIKKDPKKTKASIVEGLTASFAYCDKAYAALDDKNASDPVSFFGQNRVRLGVLSFNTSHDFEHYGNIVTYLRLKKIVPPSSERRN
jgi:uncharacterized damage-inducible protein DinB